MKYLFSLSSIVIEQSLSLKKDNIRFTTIRPILPAHRGGRRDVMDYVESIEVTGNRDCRSLVVIDDVIYIRNNFKAAM
jgi:Ni,Fe-hydrogenase III component G